MPIIALLPALIAAAAAAGQGIAGAVQTGQAAEDAKNQSAAGRAQQMKLAKMQIAADQANQMKNLQQSNVGMLSSLYGSQADQAQALAQRHIGANTDTMNMLAKTYLQR